MKKNEAWEESSSNCWSLHAAYIVGTGSLQFELNISTNISIYTLISILFAIIDELDSLKGHIHVHYLLAFLIGNKKQAEQATATSDSF